MAIFKKTSKTNISSSIKSLKQTPSLWAYNLVNTIWQWAITTTRLNVLKPTTTHATLPYSSDLRLVVRKDDNKITDLASLAKTNGKLEPIDVADPRYGIVENSE